jgi:hypothetical protein
MENITVSICAAIIALLSLFATIWQCFVTRRHNILSVRPIPDVVVSNCDGRVAVSIENNGIGPLLMKNFKAVLGNEHKNNIIDWMPALPKEIYWSKWLRSFENSTIKPSDSIVLLEFKLDPENEEHVKTRNMIKQALSDLSIEFEYTDIYENKMYLPSFPLTAFKR